MVQEDRGCTFDARVWLGRERVEGRDGPPLAPRGGGRFCELTPNAQYRIEVVGTRKEVVVGVVAFGNALKLTEVDSAAGEDKASCSCLWRPHVQKGRLGRRWTSPPRPALGGSTDPPHSRSAARLRGHLPAAGAGPGRANTCRFLTNQVGQPVRLRVQLQGLDQSRRGC